MPILVYPHCVYASVLSTLESDCSFSVATSGILKYFLNIEGAIVWTTELLLGLFVLILNAVFMLNPNLALNIWISELSALVSRMARANIADKNGHYCRGGSTYGLNRHRPPFWQINHANSAYFRAIFGLYQPPSHPFWIPAPPPPFYISWIHPCTIVGNKILNLNL